jgi:hypothetical protein
MSLAAAAAAQQQRLGRLEHTSALTLEHIGELIAVLTSALSADESVRKPAEAVLEQWRGVPGYFSLLKEVIVLAEAPLEVRWLGACCFKNGIKRSWRRGKQMKGGISDEEKLHLQTHMLLLLDIVDERIAKQVAEITCQVARLEFPKGWPALIPALVGRLDAAYATHGREGLAAARVVLRALHSVPTPVYMHCLSLCLSVSLCTSGLHIYRYSGAGSARAVDEAAESRPLGVRGAEPRLVPSNPGAVGGPV